MTTENLNNLSSRKRTLVYKHVRYGFVRAIIGPLWEHSDYVLSPYGPETPVEETVLARAAPPAEWCIAGDPADTHFFDDVPPAQWGVVPMPFNFGDSDESAED